MGKTCNTHGGHQKRVGNFHRKICKEGTTWETKAQMGGKYKDE